MNMSDLIEKLIDEMFMEQEVAVIKRNDLASQLNCVPSQINYVISTRFTPIKGYLVESQRGGGGYIKITKKIYNQKDLRTEILEKIDKNLDFSTSLSIIKMLKEQELLTEFEGRLIETVLTDNVLSPAKNSKDEIRANIIKNILINL